MTVDAQTATAWAARLGELGIAVQRRIVVARQSGDDLAEAVAHEGGDTIFAIDRHVEPIIEMAIHAWPADCLPLTLIAEGFGEDGRVTFGKGASKFRLLIDPIDGTRNIMYDKRSAWFLAAVAEDHGDDTRLSHAFASAMVELPPSKQTLADVFTATRLGSCATRLDTRTGQRHALHVKPSGAPTLLHGFGQVANFFPGTKVLASELMERIASATLGNIQPGQASVFDDQYITTGGQMVELMVGHDRFCCDLRPLFYRVLRQQTGREVRGLECHPYDCAGALVAEQAGVILTDGFGRPLDAPFGVHHPVHWCGYANAKLRDAIEPVIQAYFAERGVTPA
jgi:hypothetical protein